MEQVGKKKKTVPVTLLLWVLTFQGYHALLPGPTPHSDSKVRQTTTLLKNRHKIQLRDYVPFLSYLISHPWAILPK